MVIPNWPELPARFAHEVYVLDSQQISTDQQVHKIRPWEALSNSHDRQIFILYGLAAVAALGIALYLKSLPFFKRLGKFIDRATYFAPDVIRVSLGLSLVFAAHFHSVFGPELPAGSFFFHQMITPFLYISGVALVLGLGSRLFGLLVSLFWLLSFVDRGWYMLTYVNYLGEAIALILIPRQNISLDSLIIKVKKTKPAYERWAMPIARWLFGFSLIYAAVNVKFVTAALSLDVVNRYDLTRYFHFDPLSVVLGAGLVECLIAVLYILGLLQRINSIVFVAFIALSLVFFKEAVWPHYLLLGLAGGIFLHKPDHLALDGWLFKRRR